MNSRQGIFNGEKTKSISRQPTGRSITKKCVSPTKDQKYIRKKKRRPKIEQPKSSSIADMQLRPTPTRRGREAWGSGVELQRRPLTTRGDYRHRSKVQLQSVLHRGAQAPITSTRAGEVERCGPEATTTAGSRGRCCICESRPNYFWEWVFYLGLPLETVFLYFNTHFEDGSPIVTRWR